MDNKQEPDSELNPADDAAGLDRFVTCLTESQSSLHAFLVASLGNYDDAGEVLQRTNLALWRKARQFDPEAKFMPWAVAVARYEVLAFYRDRSRDKHVFSEELAVNMLDATATLLPELTPRLAALRECIAELPATSRDMLRHRYEDDATLLQISQQLDRTENAIKFALVRIRKALAACIDRRTKMRA
ncbi:sigma-70 family RNA polymerase sigma factor [Aeoliella sp.]|uniref:sigma-70 family RNA polymerase sigma factor n=1 Tax=Aeoliella sp. TaxID=2795800 RepID=UPI003CCBA236